MMWEAAGAGESFSAEMERQHTHPQVEMEKGVLMTVLIECRSQLGRLHYLTFVGTGERVGF